MGNDDDRTRFERQPLGPRERIQQSQRGVGLKSDWPLNRSHDADRPAVVFHYRDCDERIHKYFRRLEGILNFEFQIRGHQTLRPNFVTQHRNTDKTNCGHSYGARQLRRIVHGNGNQVVGADGLHWKVGVGGVTRNCLTRLAINGGQSAQEQQQARCHSDINPSRLWVYSTLKERLSLSH